MKYSAIAIALLTAGIGFSSVARADDSPQLGITIVDPDGPINNVIQRMNGPMITEIEVDVVTVYLGGGAYLVCEYDEDGIDPDSCDIESGDDPDTVYIT